MLKYALPLVTLNFVLETWYDSNLAEQYFKMRNDYYLSTL